MHKKTTQREKKDSTLTQPKLLERSFPVPRGITPTGGIGNVPSLLSSPRHPRTQPTVPSPPATYQKNKLHFTLKCYGINIACSTTTHHNPQPCSAFFSTFIPFPCHFLQTRQPVSNKLIRLHFREIKHLFYRIEPSLKSTHHSNNKQTNKKFNFPYLNTTSKHQLSVST